MKLKHLLIVVFVTIIASCNKSKNNKEDLSPISQDNAVVNRIVGIGKVTPEEDIIQLSSASNGIVQKIYKHENDSVRKGDIILELQHTLEDAKVAQLSNEVFTQAQQIKVDEATLDDAIAKHANTKSKLQRLVTLLAKGSETQQTIEDATTNLNSEEAILKKLNAVINVTKSNWNETKAALKFAQQELQQKIIVSPINGKILEISVLVGSAITIQQSFAQISPLGKTIAICEIDELYANKIFVGQKGWIRNVGSTDTLALGTIYFTSSFLKKKSLFTDQSGEKEDRRVRTIKLMLQQPEKLLLNARIECVIEISNNSTP